MADATWYRPVLLALVLAAPLGPAAARGCDDATTQIQLDQCAGDAFATADAALNFTYKTIMARLESEDGTRKALVGAQKAWLAFRDAECDFEAAGARGGSIQPMIVAQCRTRLTEARTGALRGFLTCAEGDAGCPVPPK